MLNTAWPPASAVARAGLAELLPEHREALLALRRAVTVLTDVDPTGLDGRQAAVVPPSWRRRRAG